MTVRTCAWTGEDFEDEEQTAYILTTTAGQEIVSGAAFRAQLGAAPAPAAAPTDPAAPTTAAPSGK